MARTLRRGRRLARRTLNDRRQRFSRSGAGGLLQIAGVERRSGGFDNTPAMGIALIAWGSTFGAWMAGSALLSVGTAMVYPTLLAAIGDVAHPSWRASASASTGSGVMPGTRWVPIWQACWRTYSVPPLPSGRSLRSPLRPDSSSPSACTKPHRPTTFDVDPARTV